MTPQEIAVAQSHIGVWKVIAKSDCDYTLVLDDIFFRRRFARAFDRAWTDLMGRRSPSGRFDSSICRTGKPLRGRHETACGIPLRPSRGLWQLSGYVLSKTGAQRLVELLPVRGPVDSGSITSSTS